MRARYAYPLLCLAAAALFALVCAVFAGGTVAGLLWLFAFGDDAWPASAEYVVMAVVTVIFLAVLGLVTWQAYDFGRRREAAGGVSGRHALVAMAVTALLAGLVVGRLWQTGLLEERPHQSAAPLG